MYVYTILAQEGQVLPCMHTYSKYKTIEIKQRLNYITTVKNEEAGIRNESIGGQTI